MIRPQQFLGDLADLPTRTVDEFGGTEPVGRRKPRIQVKGSGSKGLCFIILAKSSPSKGHNATTIKISVNHHDHERKTTRKRGLTTILITA